MEQAHISLFFLTLDFMDAAGWEDWLPQTITVKGGLDLFDFTQASYDHFGHPAANSGLIFAHTEASEERWFYFVDEEIIGWFNCGAKTNGRYVCALNFAGTEDRIPQGYRRDTKNHLINRRWFRVAMTFEDDNLCHIAGRLQDGLHADEEYYVNWEGKRLCE